MPYTYTLNASAVPAPQVPVTYLNVTAYEVTSSVPAGISSKSFVTGSLIWTAKCNRNGALADAIAQAGAGAMGLVTGLVLTPRGSGLIVDISVGIGLPNGFRQLDAAATVTVLDNQNNYIWWKQDGTFESRSAISPPSTEGIFIGTAIASGGNVTSIDGSGIVFNRSNQLYRETADLGMPTDTPPVNWAGLTKTAGGLYLWDGTKYTQVGEKRIILAKTANYAIVANNDTGKIFSNAGAAGQVDFTLPTASPGDIYTFVVEAAQTLKIIAGASTTLRIANNVSAAAGNLTNNVIGGVVQIIAMSSTKWVAMFTEGTWTIT